MDTQLSSKAAITALLSENWLFITHSNKACGAGSRGWGVEVEVES